jgi:hypothetical protein
MNTIKLLGYSLLSALVTSLANAQRGEEEVPLMRPDEKKIVEAQANEFNQALSSVLDIASKSTVRIWGIKGKRSAPEIIAYGTVVGDGTQILTKWSEVEPSIGSLFAQNGNEDSYPAEVSGVFTDEDLVLLDISNDDDKPNLKPAEFRDIQLTYGRFLVASQPTQKPGAFGVVSVLERNLRETDQAHLGIIADTNYQGSGVRIIEVQAGYGAAEAGLRAGDIILSIGDRKISGLQELRNALTDKSPGDTIEILIEAAGKEQKMDILLSNRPILGQFSGDRLNTMERMGGELSKVRNGFSRVIQSDMKIKKNQVGGPVVDLDGNIVGITMARADRTRTFIMSSKSILSLLESETDTIAQAKEKNKLKRQELAALQRAMIPQVPDRGRPRDLDEMKRNLRDLKRLRDRANKELESLENERNP